MTEEIYLKIDYKPYPDQTKLNHIIRSGIYDT